MREKGIPSLNGRHAGDQLVRVNVWVPTKLSREEKSRLTDLAKGENFSPKPGDKSAHSEKSFFTKKKNLFS